MGAYRGWVAWGAVVGLLAVAAAAAAAHGDQAGGDPAGLRARSSAAQMLGWHALALVATGIWGAQGGRLTHAAGGLFTLGLVLFCGAVYVPLVGGPTLGLAAPVGGVALMLGWAALAASAIVR